MTHRRRVGDLGEQAAAEFLIKRRYAILARNYRTRHGEIDIVARDGGTIVFVEVKTKHGGALGLPEEMVGRRKMERIILAALEYLRWHDGGPCRFDLVTLMRGRDGKACFNHIENAFGLHDRDDRGRAW